MSRWTPETTRDFLQERADLVEAALDRVVPRETQPPEQLHAAMRHTLMAPAKRLRPVLLLAAAEAAGPLALDDAMPAACAVELIHTYSLIHDDLPCMDDDALRRGRPTCHVVYGEALALLAGDALLTHAFGLLANVKDSDGKLSRLLTELAAAAGTSGMIGGQVEDLAVEGRDVPLETLRAIHRRKTGAMIRAAVRMGAMINDAGDAQLEALTTYGEAFGLAFQIVDDVLDVVGDEATMGKAAGRDAARGKATYPALLGLDEARRLAAEAAKEAEEAVAIFGARGVALAALARYVVARQW